ncbi:MAG TPA: protoporphyrinogen oxidase [Fimbriimonas sp.]|nr:protoporphyrinogen oxidase [Fimbriimonas sp.]
MRVAIVGGGITGLACALTLEKAGIHEIVLSEAADRLGGKVQTVCEQGFTVEIGADAIFTRKPVILGLIQDLGLEDEIIQPSTSQFSILQHGRLCPVSSGLLRFGAIDQEALAQADFLSAQAKMRVLEEERVPAGTGEDESIASFFCRRYGEEYSQKIAEPLLAGTHGGAPEQLSMMALYPNYVQLEQKFGSLAAGMRRLGAPAERPTFISFRRGLGTLVEALKGSLKKTRVVHEDVSALDSSFSHTVLAIPAPHASTLLASTSPEASRLLASIPMASSAIVTFGFEAALDLQGSGFLVPYSEEAKITGATWSSNKWVERAPEGQTLLRVFIKRDIETLTDEELIETARNALSLPAPSYIRVQRWQKALPLYEVGHLEKVQAIEAALPPGVHLAGQSYRGVGIPDCVAQGLRAAGTIVMGDVFASFH